MARMETGRTARRLLAGALGTLAAVAVVPAGAQACQIPMLAAQPIAPSEGASLVQTGDPLPVRIRFGDNGRLAPVQVGIARLTAPTLPPTGVEVPPEARTVVETIPLTYDPAAGAWGADANGNGWAQTPGEYVWQATGTQTFPAPPPRDASQGFVACNLPPSVSHDGRWIHRLTVIGDSAVTAKAAKARDGRAKVRGRVAKAFEGKVRLTIACPGKRARTTFVSSAEGRWSRTVFAKRGCTIKAAVTARKGWAASEASARIA